MSRDQAAMSGRGLSPAYQRRPQLRQTNCWTETPVSMLIAVSELSGPLHFQHRMTGRGSIRSMTASLYARLTKWSTRENQSLLQTIL